MNGYTSFSGQKAPSHPTLGFDAVLDVCSATILETPGKTRGKASEYFGHYSRSSAGKYFHIHLEGLIFWFLESQQKFAAERLIKQS